MNTQATPESEVPCGRCGAPITAVSPGGVCTDCLVSSMLGLHPAGEEGNAIAPMPGPAGAPEILGFHITEKLGEGGFGEVYAAEQQRPVRREVAIKVLKPGAGGDQSLARFEAERQALALMDHPGIARVYDAGETSDGRPFIVMERIRGVPILEFCEEEAIDLQARLQLFQSICDAVGHAHRRGIIHRDIKPSNILVRSEDGEAVAKVIDFGIAKATESLLTERTLLTQQNQLVGTPAYMSPEQAEPRGAVDVRSDIYSLGVLLYELVTGTPPFSSEELQELPYDEVLRRIRTEQPQRPSLRARKSAMITLSSELDWIVMKAMEKDPVRRYETANALARDVKAFLTGDLVSARPPSARYRVGKFVRKHRLAVGAVAAILFALIAGTIVSTLMFLQSEENAGKARASAEQAEQSDLRGREQSSKMEFDLADSLVESEPGLAVAHLTRALRSDPKNQAAGIRLRHLLASKNWPRQVFPPIESQGNVREIAYSRDSEMILIPSHAGTLDIRDAQTGERLHEVSLRGQSTHVAVSPDGIHAAVFGAKGGASLINIERGEIIVEVPTKSARGGSVSFSADGSLLACAADGKRVQLVEVATGAVVRQVDDLKGANRAHFGPQGKQLALFHRNLLSLIDGTATADEETPILELQFPSSIREVLFTPDGFRIVVRCRDQIVRVIEVPSGKILQELPHGSDLHSMAVSPDGSLLATGSSAGSAHVWDLESGQMVTAVPRHPEDANVEVVFSPDGRWVASGARAARTSRASVRIWEARSGREICSPIYHPRGAEALAFSRYGQEIAVASRSRLTAVWNLQARSMRPIRIRHSAPVWRFAIDETKQQLLTLTSGGEARAWDLNSGNPQSSGPETHGAIAVAAHATRGRGPGLRHGFLHGRQTTSHEKLDSESDLIAPEYREGKARAAAASRDGELLATACADGLVRIWSIREGTLLRTMGKEGAELSAVAFDAGALQVAAGDANGFVRVWDVESGNERYAAALHDKRVLALAFGPSDFILATGSADESARLVDMRLAEAIPPLRHTGLVSQIAFAPNGGSLATSGSENAARLWDTSDGRELTPPLKHLDRTGDQGLYLLWTPDSERLITTASNDNTARVWSVRSGKQLSGAMLQPAGAICAELSMDGRALLFGSDGWANTRVWDIESGSPLTPLLEHDSPAISCAFSPQRDRFVVGTLAGNVYIHSLSDPGASLSAASLRFAETLGGFRFNEEVVLERSDAVVDRKLLAKSVLSPKATGTPDPWMDWLRADPAKRPIAPRITQSQEHYLERLVESGRSSGWNEALRWRPGRAEYLAGYAASLGRDAKNRASSNFLMGLACEAAPDDSEIQVSAAGHWLARGEEGRGLLAFGQILKADAENKEAWLALGRSLADLGSLFDARAALLRAGEIGEEELGRLARRLPLSLRKRLESVTASDSEDFLHAVALLGSEDPLAVVRWGLKALESEPDEPRRWQRLGELCLAASQCPGVDDPPSLFECGLACLIAGIAPYSRLEELAARMGMFDENAPLIVKLGSEGDEKPAPPETPRARIAGRLNLEMAVKTLELNGFPEAWLRGVTATMAGEDEKGVAFYSEAARLKPGSARIENRLGVSHYRLEQLDAAIDAFARALAAAENEAPVLQRTLRLNLHHCLRKVGRHEEAQRHWLVLNEVPLREAGIPDLAVDLSMHYNAPLSHDWNQPPNGNSLASLKPGYRNFAGTDFDVRAVIQLTSKDIDNERFPESVTIPLGRTCRSLSFLHGAVLCMDPDGTKIGSYLLHYADGTKAEFELLRAVNIQDWWEPEGPAESLDLPAATCAWTGSNPPAKGRDRQLCLHRANWTNPHPDKEIKALEFRSDMAQGAPLLVALTVEETDPSPGSQGEGENNNSGQETQQGKDSTE